MDKIPGDPAVEEGTYPIRIYFRDGQNDEITPDSIAWSLCEPDGTIVNSRTAVAVGSPAAAITIVLTGDDLAKTTTKQLEPRYLHIAAVYSSDLGASLPWKKEFVFYIEDAVAVT